MSGCNSTSPRSGSGATNSCDGAVTPCLCSSIELRLKFIEIRGLYKPGFDDRPVKPPGTTRNSGYVFGYISSDDKGRIFTNRALDGTWSKDQQYIELIVHLEVIPSRCPLPPGTKVRWLVEDPDDPTNEAPNVHPDAGRLLDPNDYSGVTKTGANSNDNDPRGKATAVPRLEQVDAKYALTGIETLVDPATLTSVVRFHVSDIAGDNYRIQAQGVHPSVTTSTPSQTGVMTVWHRIEIEYVKMASARELPVDQIGLYYDIACVQVDVSEKRVVSGLADKTAMGTNEGLADAACVNYCTKASGEFTHEGQGGWFFIAAANRFVPAQNARILYEGNAEAHGDRILLLGNTTPAGIPPKVIRVFDSSMIVGMSPPKPNNYDIHIKFRVTGKIARNLTVMPHDFHDVHDPDNAFLEADLSHYGFTDGTIIPVQVLSAGDEAMVTGGISPGGIDVGGRHYFGGKLLVFTQSLTGTTVITLCHELCHAFDNAHKCGNWDWEQKANRTSCCMNYWFQFVLDNSTPRRPIPWTQNRQTANMCGPHIISIRDYHLEDNPGLGW